MLSPFSQISLFQCFRKRQRIKTQIVKTVSRILIVIVMLCCIVGRTRCQDTTEASAGTRSVGSLPFQLVLPREHLLGDWFTTRTWLEDHGITPTLTFDTDSLGNPSGGKEQGFTTANNVGFDLNFDLEKLDVVNGGSF